MESQKLDPRYVSKEKLVHLLQRLFPNKQCDIEVNLFVGNEETQLIIAGKGRVLHRFGATQVDHGAIPPKVLTCRRADGINSLG